MRDGEDIDIEAVQKELIKKRESKWDEFFNRYKKIQETLDAEEDDGKSVISLESGDSHSEGTSGEVEEEERVEDDENSAAENDSNNEDEDENPADQEFFENFFQQFCKQTTETMERSHEEHTKEELKTQNGSRYVERLVRKNESATKRTSFGTPMSNQRALTWSSVSKTPDRATNNNRHDRALVKASPSALMEPFASMMNNSGPANVIIRYTTTTTTTTTTEERIFKYGNTEELEPLSISDDGSENDHRYTENEPIVEMLDDDDDNVGFKRPKSQRTHTSFSRKRQYQSHTVTTPSSTKQNQSISEVITLRTPQNRRSLISGKEVQKCIYDKTPISQLTPKQRKLNKIAIRDYGVKKGESLQLVPAKSIDQDSESSDDEDPLRFMRDEQRAIAVKSI